MKQMTFENFYQHDTDIYSLEGFSPVIVDRAYLEKLGVTVHASEETYAKLRENAAAVGRLLTAGEFTARAAEKAIADRE